LEVDGVHDRPPYLKVLLTFARNSLIRDMTFRGNFIIEAITSITWMLMNLGFYLLIFQYTPAIGNTGWGQYQFFVFLATTLFINSMVQMLFMPNAEEFSELIRTGNLDFALLKPIDTQFLISLRKMEWSGIGNLLVGLALLIYSLKHVEFTPSLAAFILYPVYVICGVAILYSLMIVMSAASVWLGRNQSIYDFWFYVTNFSRYPMEIYQGRLGTPLQWFFTFIIPVLVVVNVPARLLAMPFAPEKSYLALFALLATGLSLFVSRQIFLAALGSYRSASS